MMQGLLLTKSNCMCRVNVNYAPPEFCAVKYYGGGEYVFDDKAEVWSLGCMLADMAGIPRAWEKITVEEHIQNIAELPFNCPV